MFANEEFDLDEDFLNDLSQRESQYYSQRLSSDEERCVKKFKNDENRASHAISQKNISLTGANEDGSDKTFRTNTILERLKRHKTTNYESNVVGEENKLPTSNAESPTNLAEDSSWNNKNNNDSRKNLILEIFRKNIVESDTAGPSTSSEVKAIRTNSVISVDNREIEQCKTVEKSSKPVCKPIALVRQFPGPAGLLPDVSNESMIPQALLELSDLAESNDCTDVDKANDSSVVSNYYSQNTSSLFNDGAWQSLIDDLDEGFLNGHEISMIKQKVLTNSYRNNKVPFLAGIVQKVDFGRPDPTVVLKDCTGSIEGTICKDILSKYPKSLDIGAVLFLGNVGLLTVGSYLKKFHLIVTMKNIVNMYVGKTKTYDRSEMHIRLKDFINDSQFSNRALNRVSNHNHSLNSKFNGGPNIQNSRINEGRNAAFDSQNSDNSSNRIGDNINVNFRQSERHNVKTSNIPERKDIDHKITKSTFESENFEDFDDDFAASFFDIDDNLNAENVPTVEKVLTKDITVTSKESTDVPNTVNSNVKNNSSVPNDTAKKVETVERKVTTVVNEKQNPTKSSNARLKLAVFRSNSELTPPNSEDIDSILPETNIKEQSQSNSMSDLLLNKENDSDEEIFSQLDIESIVSNYNCSNNVKQ